MSTQHYYKVTAIHREYDTVEEEYFTVWSHNALSNAKKYLLDLYVSDIHKEISLDLIRVEEENTEEDIVEENLFKMCGLSENIKMLERGE